MLVGLGSGASLGAGLRGRASGTGAKLGSGSVSTGVGRAVCPAVVEAVVAPASCDRTPQVRLSFDAAFLYEVRQFSWEVSV